MPEGKYPQLGGDLCSVIRATALPSWPRQMTFKFKIIVILAAFFKFAKAVLLTSHLYA